MAAPLIERLRIKPGMRVLLMNPAPGFIEQLGTLPHGVTLDSAPDGLYDCVLLFARSKADADRDSLIAVHALKEGGLFWACYPKLTGAIKTDITRDKGWDGLVNAGWAGIAIISIDDTWSALRWRPNSDIKRAGEMR